MTIQQGIERTGMNVGMMSLDNRCARIYTEELEHGLNVLPGCSSSPL